MTEQVERVSGRRRAWEWLIKYQWHIIGSIIILAIPGVFSFGYFSSDEFVRDFAANLAADAVVAVVAFAVINMAFGLRERRQRQFEARAKALMLLIVELTENEVLLEGMLQALKGELPMPVPCPALGSHTWELFLQSPLVTHLDTDLLWNLFDTYIVGRQALETVRSWQREPGWKPSGQPPPDLLSGLKKAHQRTVDTISMLLRLEP